MAWKITIKGAAEAPAEVKAAIREGQFLGLEAAGIRGVQLVQETYLQPPFGAPVVATGLLANSIVYGSEQDEGIVGRVRIHAEGPAGGYAGYVEAGTRPHFPPVSALMLWVKKKFGIEDEKQARSVAFLVARAIAKRGTLGRGIFNAALGKLLGELKGIFEARIGAAIERAGVGRG